MRKEWRGVEEGRGYRDDINICNMYYNQPTKRKETKTKVI
jgi:hypothetical protein